MRTELAQGLTREQRAVVQKRLWQLLARRAERYTQGDSSSLRAETAEELFESICFSIRHLLISFALPQSALLDGDLDEMLQKSQELLKRQTDEAKRWYQAALSSAPALDNRALRDTLKGIGPFFHRYDFLFLAHQIPV